MNKIHGMSRTPLYVIWRAMKQRCYCKKHPYFSNYGGRGIGICDEWRFSFVNFYEWAMENRWEMGLSIERRNCAKNYDSANCEFIPRSQQSRNRTNSFWIVHENKKMLLEDWARETGINKSTISSRIKRGWKIENALKIAPGTIRTGPRGKDFNL